MHSVSHIWYVQGRAVHTRKCRCAHIPTRSSERMSAKAGSDPSQANGAQKALRGHPPRGRAAAWARRQVDSEDGSVSAGRTDPAARVLRRPPPHGRHPHAAWPGGAAPQGEGDDAGGGDSGGSVQEGWAGVFQG